jgi:hypothetical protein
MSVMDIKIEPRRVRVFFDRRSPSRSADQQRIERAAASALVLALGEAGEDAHDTLPMVA